METKVKVCGKQKYLALEELNLLSKEQLMDKVVQLQRHNQQLKNIIHKNLTDQKEKQEPAKDKKRKRPFNFAVHQKRHIMIRLYYLGWDYQGFASQDDTTNTIEYHLLNALTKVCLIESPQEANYQRCGRTDRGVSAFHQVISLTVRSKLPPEEQLSPSAMEQELSYCTMLNRVLPEDIRCVAWMPVRNPLYSARFDCQSRTYRYFFPHGELDVGAMKEACGYLVGTHDFRNLCKMDVANGVVNFMRHIEDATVRYSRKDAVEESYSMLYLEIRGHAFLWHQIRCIMAVLLMIGNRQEEPTVMQELLNVEKNPCKPQYSMANDLPLNLYECQFKERAQAERSNQTDASGSELTDWIYDQDGMSLVIKSLQVIWTKHSVKATMTREMLDNLETTIRGQGTTLIPRQQASCLLQGVSRRDYRPLLNRPTCASLENRIEHYAKKQRIEVSTKSADGQNATGSEPNEPQPMPDT